MKKRVKNKTKSVKKHYTTSFIFLVLSLSVLSAVLFIYILCFACNDFLLLVLQTFVASVDIKATSTYFYIEILI